MSFQVWLTASAERDIEEIYRYIALNDSVENAERILDSLQELCIGLADLPARGNVPKELDEIGIKRFREVRFKPYRVIYELDGPRVFIHCVLDGRRDMQSLLERRLLR